MIFKYSKYVSKHKKGSALDYSSFDVNILFQKDIRFSLY